MRATLAFLALLAWPRPSSACDCGGYERNDYGACRDTDQSQAIFAGKVLSVRKTGPVAMTEFQVLEAFRGISTPTVVLIGGISSCDYRFAANESYFVYASVDPTFGRFGAYTCGGTGLLKDADRDLAYARAGGYEKPFILGGTVEFYERLAPSDYRNRRRLAAVPMTITGAGRTLHVITGSDGAFAVAHPSPGVYTVHADMPPPFRAQPDGKATVRAGDCGGYVAFMTDGLAEINGRVVDESGHPRQSVTVTAAPVGMTSKGDTPRGESDALGRYTIRWLVPGPYVLRVRREKQVPDMQPWPYPDTILAGVIDVAGPFVRTVDDLVIPESTKFRVDK